MSVTVSCDDNPPTAVDDSATVAEDSPASAIAVLANDTDTDGGPKSVASVTQPANGTVVITGGGSGLTYQPNANYCNSQAGGAPDTFTYTLNGGDSATVSVTVTCVDDPPTAVNDAATVVEDSAAGAVAVLANDLNADGGPITIASASDPANGTVAVTGGGTGLTYQPDANYCSATPDTFTYTLNGGSTATVSMTVTCAPDNPMVDTSAGSTSYTENAAATAIDAAVTVTDPDAGTTITGATVKITVGYAGAEDILALGGTHPDITPTVSGDTLTLSGNASVAAYQAALRAVTYRNSSDAPSTAPRTVTFTVTDDTSRTGSDTKGLTVAAVDDPPTAVADSATVLEDAAATAITVLTNDTDVDAGPRSVASVTQPANGTVAITGGGTGLTYQPNANYCNTPPGTTPSTFTYTLNGGSSATVSVTVTCVNDAPVADDETFDAANGAIGNTSLVVNDPDDGAPALSSPKKSITGDILAGDSDIDGPGPLTVTAGTFATNDGGSVTIEADGDFIYINDPADNCADTSDFFDYTVSDQNPAGPGPAPGTDTGRVTIAVAGCVWYVSNNATGNSGTSIAPFDTLTQAETASAANHTVFVFDGDNTSTGYDGNGYTMNAGERLIGEHEGLTVDPDGAGGPLAAQTLHPANPGAYPTLTATGADVVDLDDANEVRGLTLDPQGTGGGIAGSSGDVSGTIDDVNITDTGTAGTQPGLELDATTGSFAVSNLAVSTTGATGVRLNNAGTVTFAPTGNISITTSGAAGLLATGGASGTNMGTSVFDAITATGSGAGGVSLTNTTGTTTFADLALTTTSGATAAFALSNAGTVSVPAAGTANVSATGGPAVDVTATTVNPTLAFDTVSSSSSANDGINLDGLGAGTFTAAGTSTITGAAGIAFDLNGGSGDITFPGTITNGQGSTAEITGRTAGTVTLSGPITETGDADATQENGGIAVTGNSGGSTVVSNATKTFNTGEDHAIVMGTSDGHTLAVSGGSLDIDTTSGQGLAATTSGTLVVSGTGNTIDSVSATALNVANTDIGAAGATFLRISSGNNTADPDPANGIVLNGTGSAAGLTVTGTGSANSGGAIQNTTGDAVLLSSASSVSLTDMSITTAGGSWIDASTVNGLTLTRLSADLSADHGLLGNSLRNLVISGGTFDRGAQSAGICNRNGINITNLLGTSSVTGARFTRSNTSQFRVNNNTATNFAGTPDSLTVSGTTWNDHNVGGCFGDHLSVNSDTGGNFRLTVNSTAGINIVNPDGNANGGGIGVQATAGGTNGKMDADITGLKTSNNTAGAVVAATASGSITYNIHDNNTDPPGTANDTGFSGTGSLALAATCAVTTGSCVGTFNNNDIAATAGAGTDAMQAVLEGNGTHTIRIANMDITGNFQRGINLSSGGGSGAVGTMNATLTNNRISGSDPGSLQGVNITAGLSGSPGNGETNKMCLNMVGNTSSQASGSAGFRLTNRASNVFQLQDFAGSGASATDISNWVTAAPKSNVGTVAVQNAPTTFGPLSAAPGSCPTPP